MTKWGSRFEVKNLYKTREVGGSNKAAIGEEGGAGNDVGEGRDGGGDGKSLAAVD